MTGAELRRPIEILLVEDNPGDVTLTKVGLREGTTPSNVNVVMDGVEAMAYLRREGEYHGAVRPDIVLLDLNLPAKNGREVLADIRQDPELEDLPVVVLTTSDSDQDIRLAYKLKANCYITKPVDYDEFLRVLGQLDSFWFSTVQLPTR